MFCLSKYYVTIQYSFTTIIRTFRSHKMRSHSSLYTYDLSSNTHSLNPRRKLEHETSSDTSLAVHVFERGFKLNSQSSYNFLFRTTREASRTEYMFLCILHCILLFFYIYTQYTRQFSYSVRTNWYRIYTWGIGKIPAFELFARGNLMFQRQPYVPAPTNPQPSHNDFTFASLNMMKAAYWASFLDCTQMRTII